MKNNIISGDVFTVALSDGDKSLGQVIRHDKRAISCVSVALFDHKIRGVKNNKELSMKHCISTMLVVDDLFDDLNFIKIETKKLSIPKKYYPYEKIIKKGGVGMKITNPANVVNFLEAYHGLSPWDMMADNQYFDKFLITPNKKPESLIYEKK